MINSNLKLEQISVHKTIKGGPQSMIDKHRHRRNFTSHPSLHFFLAFLVSFSGALDGDKQIHKHVSHWLSKQSNYFQSCPVLWLPSQDLQRLAHLFIHLIGHDQIYHHLHNQLCIYHMTHKFDILKGILWEIYSSYKPSEF